MGKTVTEQDLSIRDPHGPGDAFLSLLGLCCIAILGWLALTRSAPDPTPFNPLAPRQITPCVMDQAGYLRGQLYGAVQETLDWQGEQMLCDGMNRPEGRGIRMVFSEHSDTDIPGLVIVIGLADAELGAPEQELVANVTIIDQTNGRFYSTQEQPRCWTRFSNQLRLTGTIEDTWRLDGRLYCASALPALVGPGSVTLGDIEYSGVMKPAADQAGQ